MIQLMAFSLEKNATIIDIVDYFMKIDYILNSHIYICRLSRYCRLFFYKYRYNIISFKHLTFW